jgi:hypothetical protein
VFEDKFTGVGNTTFTENNGTGESKCKKRE